MEEWMTRDQGDDKVRIIGEPTSLFMTKEEHIALIVRTAVVVVLLAAVVAVLIGN